MLNKLATVLHKSASFCRVGASAESAGKQSGFRVWGFGV